MRIARTAAMKKVLSPISVTRIMNSELTVAFMKLPVSENSEPPVGSAPTSAVSCGSSAPPTSVLEAITDSAMSDCCVNEGRAGSTVGEM